MDDTEAWSVKQVGGTFTSGESGDIQRLVPQGLENRFETGMILDQGPIPGLREVREQFRRSEVCMPEMRLAVYARQEGMDLLEPVLLCRRVKGEPIARVLVGAVNGDIHALSKKVFGTMLHTVGPEVHDIGTHVAAPKFVEDQGRVEAGAEINVCSALPPTMDVAKHLVGLPIVKAVTAWPIGRLAGI